LNVELARVGATAGGAKASAQLDLGNPDLDFVKLGNGMGVPSRQVQTAEELTDALNRAVAEPGPHLIEVPIPAVFSARQLRAMPYALRALSFLPRPVAAAIKRRLSP
jgi:acetolactate synthase-1/2/3 large subunit